MTAPTGGGPVLDPRADARAFLIDLFQLAVARADPMAVLAPHLPAPPEPPEGRLVVLGAGKASARMAEAVEAHYGPRGGTLEGLVVTRYGYARPCERIEIVEAAHPVPDQVGLEATARVMALAGTLGPDDLVLALVSGGGSSLLCAPAHGLTLEDKRALNAALLASGAPISAMNRVRKHASLVKGGRLAAACAPARVLSLVVSDVPGDEPSEIASGPTVGDPPGATTDIAALLDAHAVDLPAYIRVALIAHEGPLRADDPRLARVETRVVAAPRRSLDAAAGRATQAGVEVRCLGDAIEGEARDVAAEQARLALAIADAMAPGAAPVLLLSGGECTVTRRGDGASDGTGGPNAEFALAAAVTLGGDARVHVLACDTDGVDGAAEVAGAYAHPGTLARARERGVDPADALARNDAHGFFGAVGGQVVTGPTLTNVNDFRVLLVTPPED